MYYHQPEVSGVAIGVSFVVLLLYRIGVEARWWDS